MKRKIAKFLLFVYTTHIVEEWDVITPFGKKVLYPAWLVRSFLVWLFCFIFIPEYLFKQSKVYKKFQKAEKIALKL